MTPTLISKVAVLHLCRFSMLNVPANLKFSKEVKELYRIATCDITFHQTFGYNKLGHLMATFVI